MIVHQSSTLRTRTILMTCPNHGCDRAIPQFRVAGRRSTYGIGAIPMRGVGVYWRGQCLQLCMVSTQESAVEARIMMPEHSFVSYIVGLLFGLGLVIYALYSIKRGSVIWRGRGY